jgi:hypothetical protein
MKNAFGAVVLVALLGARTLSADVWDQTTDNDDDTTTNNALMHGTDQLHDLADLPTGAGDRDWYNVTVRPFSSYEVVVEGQTGDLNFDGASIRRFQFPATFLQDSVPAATFAYALRWANGSASTIANTVQVRALACDTLPCTAHDQYRIRAYDSTYTIPRFNNSGTQVTVFLIQNATESTCNVNVHYFGPTGSNLASSIVAVAARGLLTLQTASVVGGQSGSARVTHDCGYGGLSGKAVSLEPSTGFTFDTAMSARPL